MVFNWKTATETNYLVLYITKGALANSPLYY